MLTSIQVFGVIRNVAPFRLAGMTKGTLRPTCPRAELMLDFILISSDSGRLSIIEFVVTPTPHFESLYQEVFGKSGSR